MTVAAVLRRAAEAVLITGSCSVVGVLAGVGCEAGDKAGVERVVAEDVIHLTLAPGIVVAVTVLCRDKESKLHCAVQSCAAPLVKIVITALHVASAGAVCPAHAAAPVAADLCTQDLSALCNGVPAVDPAEILLLVGFHLALVILILGCEIEPCGRPLLLVLRDGVGAGIVEGLTAFHRTVGCDGIIGGGELIQCLCVLQGFLIAVEHVILRERCGIICCHIGCAVAGPVHSSAASLLFRGAPVLVITDTGTFLIEEVGNGIAGELRGCLEEIGEVLEDGLEVCFLLCDLERFRELVVCPADGGSSHALRQTEHNMVACVVVAARHLIIGVAVAAPLHCALRFNVLAAHIGVKEVQAVLQQLCVVVACCADGRRRRADGGQCGERNGCTHDSRNDTLFEFAHVKIPLS